MYRHLGLPLAHPHSLTFFLYILFRGKSKNNKEDLSITSIISSQQFYLILCFNKSSRYLLRYLLFFEIPNNTFFSMYNQQQRTFMSLWRCTIFVYSTKNNPKLVVVASQELFPLRKWEIGCDILRVASNCHPKLL